MAVVRRNTVRTHEPPVCFKAVNIIPHFLRPGRVLKVPPRGLDYSNKSVFSLKSLCTVVENNLPHADANSLESSEDKCIMQTVGNCRLGPIVDPPEFVLI